MSKEQGAESEYGSFIYHFWRNSTNNSLGCMTELVWFSLWEIPAFSCLLTVWGRLSRTAYPVKARRTSLTACSYKEGVGVPVVVKNSSWVQKPTKKKSLLTRRKCKVTSSRSRCFVGLNGHHSRPLPRWSTRQAGIWTGRRTSARAGLLKERRYL